ncbi:single-stranded DNA-binding protein [Entomospira entomophila]|uniref:Single-stranded DNA-binding protein n=1 Tax=Entomospira entomophila TaxID=2719988 RepID=A0A968KQS0_9SPIO|nr:single-stranded DNA-binding protein [Entomospira entomophilus]NIZ39988.1 single-stranded DNA-binding protein [Entomospira entomophilus]WDI35548.1 single-stranded DNA-binding protein [Entomospira entomophilus]
MADVNRVVLVGRLTKDAELKYTTNTNLAITRFSIAVNARRKQEDQWVDEASFFDITLFGKQGETLHNYLQKGKQVAVEGQLRQDRWEQDGQMRSRVYVLADNIMLLGGGNNDQGGERGASFQQGSDFKSQQAPASRPKSNTRSSSPSSMPPPVDFEDDIPF